MQSPTLKFKRPQFPVHVAFSMAINKGQGQSFKIVGLNSERPYISHGHVVVSRMWRAPELVEVKIFSSWHRMKERPMSFIVFLNALQ